MKIKFGNVVAVNCEKLDFFCHELNFFKIGGEEIFKKFLLDVVICHNEIEIHQNFLSDIVYITTSTLMDYERIIEWLNTNAEVYDE